MLREVSGSTPAPGASRSSTGVNRSPVARASSRSAERREPAHGVEQFAVGRQPLGQLGIVWRHGRQDTSTGVLARARVRSRGS